MPNFDAIIIGTVQSGPARAMHIHPTVSEFIPTMMDQLKPLQ
jgi:hypothetical protein